MICQSNKRKIGIFGGSFDPIHQGHLNIARSAYEEFSLDEVWFIPAGHSPNKDEHGMTSATNRAEMVELAIAPYPYFKLSRIEIEAQQTSYTYLTLSKIKEQYPDAELYFIMGADSLDYFEKWKHPEIICEKAIILAAVRDDMDVAVIQKKITEIQSLFPARIYPIRGGRTEVSSTELRSSYKKAGSISAMIPDAVGRYIREHGLYSNEMTVKEADNGSK